MIRKIAGTEQTRSLITNIIGDFHSKRPLTKHVDYSITMNRNSTLLTDENGDTFRNVSIIYLKGIQAAIGNKTGNILINQKPLLVSTEEAIKRICVFLEKIQPQNLKKASIINEASDTIPEVNSLGLTPDFTKVTQDLKSDGLKVRRTITGSNNTWSGERFEEYKTL